MWPVDHSSASRTSTTTAPLATWSRTTDGSTSSILLLIWRRTSAPDGLIAESPQTRSGFNTSVSIATPRGRDQGLRRNPAGAGAAFGDFDFSLGKRRRGGEPEALVLLVVGPPAIARR